MTISASQVKELRESTGAGMMECKKALVESEGNYEKAVEILRKKGAAKADKKAGRIAAEGVVVFAQSGGISVLAEINSETDFAAKNEDFLAFAQQVLKTALAAKTEDLTVFANTTVPGTQETIEQTRLNLVAKIGENILIRRIAVVSTSGFVGSYLHGSRIGVLVALEGGSEVLAKDIAMHIAASRPITINRSDVPAELIAKEKDIFKAQADQTGKPAEIIEKMVQGRVNKFLDEVSLEGQPFVKDPNLTITQLLKNHQAKVVKFVRFEVGEGIEKKQDNFAEEVMAQVQGA